MYICKDPQQPVWSGWSRVLSFLCACICVHLFVCVLFVLFVCLSVCPVQTQQSTGQSSERVILTLHIHTCTSHMVYIHVLHIWYTYMYFTYGIHTCTSHMVYIHVLHIWYTYMYFTYGIHTWTSHMVYIHVLHVYV